MQAVACTCFDKKAKTQLCDIILSLLFAEYFNKGRIQEEPTKKIHYRPLISLNCSMKQTFLLTSIIKIWKLELPYLEMYQTESEQPRQTIQDYQGLQTQTGPNLMYRAQKLDGWLQENHWSCQMYLNIHPPSSVANGLENKRVYLVTNP